jgi:hypothetical protein
MRQVDAYPASDGCAGCDNLYLSLGLSLLAAIFPCKEEAYNVLSVVGGLDSPSLVDARSSGA